MLLSTEVEVVLYSGNIEHYESLGYEIPRYIDSHGCLRVRRGSKIKVKVNDLTEGSNVLVKIKYDCCGKISDMPYYAYKRHNHDGKIYCTHCNCSILLSGENNPNYNKEKTDEERQEGRKYKEYTDFIKRVLARDKYTCQCCGHTDDDSLEIHHLNGYNWCIEGRCDDTNGITLCEKCHSNFHSIYGYGNNTKEQFEQWMGRAIELVKYEQELCPTRMFYCFEDNMIYSSVRLYAKDNNFSYGNIYNACNQRIKTAYGKHYVWYDKFLLMTDAEKEQYIKR